MPPACPVASHVRRFFRDRAILGCRRGPHRDEPDRIEGRKFLVHFVGDLHQLLHRAERDGDRGANPCPLGSINDCATLPVIRAVGRRKQTACQ